jgi:hypothetical protein
MGRADHVAPDGAFRFIWNAVYKHGAPTALCLTLPNREPVVEKWPSVLTLGYTWNNRSSPARDGRVIIAPIKLLRPVECLCLTHDKLL